MPDAGTGSGLIDCVWCGNRHPSRYLCDTVARFLAAMKQRADGYNMPTLELSEPLPAEALGIGADPSDRVVAQLVVQAATGEIAGSTQPMLILSGTDHVGGRLPQWVLPADDATMRRYTRLFDQMAMLSIRTAVRQRRERGE